FALALSEITWTDRPQLFTLALFPMLFELLLAARAGRTVLLVAAPPLFLIWTNLHGGYALGLALVAIFAGEAILTRRNAVPFAATPFLPAGTGELWSRWRPASRFALPRPATLGIGAGLAAVLAFSIATAPHAPDESRYPVAARDQLKGTTGNVLNEYDWGGFLIWRVPERPGFIDGRLFVFLPDVLTDYEEMVFVRPRWREELDRYAIGAVLLHPDRPLVAALRDQGWAVLTQDANAVLLRRPVR